MSTTTGIDERFSREALLTLAPQYESVAQALAELVDNPIDYRRGRDLVIDLTVEKRNDILRVFDYGGQGMNDEGLMEWISWGMGHRHALTDIGQYHVGGKGALMYLAEDVEIICRKADDDDIWWFRDPEWGKRTEFLSGHPIKPLSANEAGRRVPGLAALDRGAGFTCITLRRLKKHRYEPKVLEARLGNTYRTLLQSGVCAISLNSKPIAPLDIPVSNVFDPIIIQHAKLEGGVTIDGSVWITDLDQMPAGRGIRTRAGIRTLFNGRLITDDEDFGHNLAGRGSLQRLRGELHIRTRQQDGDRLLPNATKTGWDKDKDQWAALESFMHDAIQPAIDFLRQQAAAVSVSRDQRKRGELVRRRIEDALRRMALTAEGSPGNLDGVTDRPGGRRPPSPPGADDPSARRAPHPRGPVTGRTPPPRDPVGRLTRRFQNGIPPFAFERLGLGSPRSQLREAPDAIVINTDFPMYKRIGEEEDYLLETALLQLLDQERDPPAYRDTRERLDALIWASEPTEVPES